MPSSGPLTAIHSISAELHVSHVGAGKSRRCREGAGLGDAGGEEAAAAGMRNLGCTSQGLRRLPAACTRCMARRCSCLQNAMGEKGGKEEPRAHAGDAAGGMWECCLRGDSKNAPSREAAILFKLL